MLHTNVGGADVVVVVVVVVEAKGFNNVGVLVNGAARRFERVELAEEIDGLLGAAVENGAIEGNNELDAVVVLVVGVGKGGRIDVVVLVAIGVEKNDG